MVISKITHSLRYEIFDILEGKVALQKIQIFPILSQEGWSARNILQPGISKFWLSVDVSKVRYISEKQTQTYKL